ncbi:ABC transporter G family member 37 [Hibiscus syriacus]|uniref:ABC transporter G family member 37 n=1 Tax=Hibiscus syriacus TaxID=106335 RepID=A0A6A3BP07_HIBSY|nr:ABC transporter G family member 37 [Hibiscus syriacus]
MHLSASLTATFVFNPLLHRPIPAGSDEMQSVRIELSDVGTSNVSEVSSLRSLTSYGYDDDEGDEYESQWAAIERLPTSERITTALFDDKVSDGKADAMGNIRRKRLVNVTELRPVERHFLVEKLVKHVPDDNLRLVGVQLPSVEVRYKNLSVQAECQLVHGKPLPTLWNAMKAAFSGIANLLGSKQEAEISILKDVSGIVKPGRMTLLLGPPGSGKSTFLLALAGKLSQTLKVSGEITYNGYRLDEFNPQKTSAYISQYDLHTPEMTVRETLDFSARFQGIGSRAEIMKEISQREKHAGIVPNPDIDAYMKVSFLFKGKNTISKHGFTPLFLQILGLDNCDNTRVGDAIRRGVSGGEKRRLTTGREMIVGPTKALFMDEISNGLDSSTSFQVVSCLQHLVHHTDATALISLLQPAPEIFELFDDVILMAEGKVVYHGPRTYICKFFEDCGFRCLERKGIADFIQEVISRKDQAQYWYRKELPYSYVSVNQFIQKFKECEIGLNLDKELSEPFEKTQSGRDSLSFKRYSLSKWELFKACSTREFLLMKRNAFLYVFKSVQLLMIGSMTLSVFLRTQMAVDIIHVNYYAGALFFTIIILFVDAFPELSMTVSRLDVFYKQRELCFYPAWAYAIPAAILKVPLSLMESFLLTALTYYSIGYSPEVGRFFLQFLVCFGLHLTGMSMFRVIASLSQTIVASTTAGTLVLLTITSFGGFIVAEPSMPSWLKWGFWLNPMSYGEIGLTLNELLAPRWEKVESGNTSIGQQTLESRGLNYDGYFYWLSVSVLFGLTVLFNVIFTLALTFLKPPGKTRAIVSFERYSQLQGLEEDNKDESIQKESKIFIESENIAVSTEGENIDPFNLNIQMCSERKILFPTGKMALPFQPLTVAFRDVKYYVNVPVVTIIILQLGFKHKRVQLLSDITGAFQPGILTALMGVSGAGKTTLMDVLSGRKTGGTIEGEIRIGGYLKVQNAFARVSGYCEQTDIHSPHLTVEESLMYSAWLRLPSYIDSKTKDVRQAPFLVNTLVEIIVLRYHFLFSFSFLQNFINEVLETIELEEIKDSIVGIAGVNGLSTEQRKRLTIAVELVANPSIMFMDEPTSGLDAKAAAIVMRAVKNVVETGRTVVCTIHQPSIHIFEAFDELILMKTGGSIIYSGPLGQQSSRVIEYFQNIPGVPKIKDDYNPATWMLEITSQSAEAQTDVDFADIYKRSSLFRENLELVKQLSSPPPDSKELRFPNRFPQNGWEQFKACLWKQHLSYWRSPSYNLTRFFSYSVSCVIFGILFWQRGDKIENQQDLFNALGVMYAAIFFFGINSISSVLPFVSIQRSVMYREMFAGMYTPWAYSFAQVIIEIPYMLTSALLYVIVTYPMIGYYWSANKVLWSFYTIWCSVLCFTYLGMMIVSITPNVQVAFIVSSFATSTMNLFSGYYLPVPYGDIDKEIQALGETMTVSAFIEDYFGYHHKYLGSVAVVLIIFPVALASLFAFFTGKLNFQRR